MQANSGSSVKTFIILFYKEAVKWQFGIQGMNAKKISPGCMNCYFYRRDAEFGKESSIVTRTVSFDLLVKRDCKREYKLQSERECVASFQAIVSIIPRNNGKMII